MKYLLPISLLLLSICHTAAAQTETILLSPDSFDHREYAVNLAGRAIIWQSRLGDETIPDSAETYTSGGLLEFVPGRCWNFHFSIKNTSATDTLRAYLVSENGNLIQVKYLDSAGGKTFRTGRHLNLIERALPGYAWALPLFLPPLDSTGVLFSLHHGMDALTYHVEPHIGSASFLEKTHAERSEKQRPEFVFMVCLFSLLGMMGALAFSQYLSIGDRAYLFYALYACTVGIYYLRNFGTFENGPDLPRLVASYHSLTESFFNLLCILFYVLFIYHFLRKEITGSKVEPWFRHGSKVLAGLVLLSLALWPVMSVANHAFLFWLVRVPAMFFSFGIILWIVALRKSVLSRFILTGTALMLVPILFTTVSNFSPKEKVVFMGGMLEKYAALPFPNYTARTGILLEMLVFLIGLNYKTWLERKEAEKTSDEKRQLEEQRKKLVASMAEQRKLRHEEHNQWANLLLHAELEKQALLEKLNGSNGSSDNGRAAGIGHPFLQQLENVLETHFADSRFGTEAFAAAMNRSRATLFRQLRELGANAPSELLRDFRLQKAATLLQSHPDLGVSQIAEACGFEDSSHFIKLFSKKYGKTPLQWRKNGGPQAL
ncbi:MAG: helix-turn-helix domain-containing protein [Lewinellaceae bacterium]|nr:helix-turn-helix domain-containing protein [Saprospiraceae bacterium]MCB9340202.1 helix-turn-helix domain-containing protein [Lewinellaceae bacterium]